ncbi:kelch domain-containing protein [Diplocarpon rosae]|nr:kelch domain-containing protein [Diplocarpon rosae]
MMELAATAVTATRGMLESTHPVKAKWERINTNPLPRSSHTLSVVAGRAYIFGGEVSPREPVDNNMQIVTLPYDSFSSADYQTIPAKSKTVGGEVPEKRVGHTAAVIGERIFVWGCPVSGRTNDLWGFDVRSRTWKEFPAAPGKPRGGTSITVSKHRIYRYGGFNGTGEEGGQVDILDLGIDTLSGTGPSTEAAVVAKGKWHTLDFTKENMTCPGNRSVAGLHAITTGMGREYLVLLFGERDPSSQGHDGAGKFWGDIWAFHIVLWGGLNGKNEREDDGWILRIE